MKLKHIILLAVSIFAAAFAFGATATVSWTDNSSAETGFKVERVNGVATATTDWSAAVVKTVPASTGTGLTVVYNDTTVAEGAVYSYRVTAFNAVTSSDPSNIASGTMKLNNPTNTTVATSQSLAAFWINAKPGDMFVLTVSNSPVKSTWHNIPMYGIPVGKGGVIFGIN